MPAIVWKGFISFGLVSIPVRLFAAARAESIHFHMLHRKDKSRVKEVFYCAEEDKPIQRSDIEKGYEVSKGKYVVVEDEELKKVAPATATTMEILQFVANDEVDPIYLERSYYVGADEKTTKPYALFVAALEASKQHAVAKIAMHNREHIVLIRPSEFGLVLHTLYYANELHEANRGRSGHAKFSAKELDLAKTLVTHLKAPFKPERYKDTYRANVERLLEEKRKGQKITVIKQPRERPVTDILEALKRSLEKSAKAQKPKSSIAKRKAA